MVLVGSGEEGEGECSCSEGSVFLLVHHRHVVWGIVDQPTNKFYQISVEY
jgi:hypothetical protein